MARAKALAPERWALGLAGLPVTGMGGAGDLRREPGRLDTGELDRQGGTARPPELQPRNPAIGRVNRQRELQLDLRSR